MKTYHWVLIPGLTLLLMWGIFKVIDGYIAGTTGKERTERIAHETQCKKLRAEFFEECQKSLIRQQCEALYGQTQGRLFDGPPDRTFVDQLECGITESPWSGR